MLERIRHNEILELHMARPPVNALNPELLSLLREAIATAPGDGTRALVISGGPKVFSGGLDVPALMGMERDELESAWREFFGVLEALARSPLPSVAAIDGHCPAGGAVISLFCDYRIMARGSFRIGLNEVQIGLIVPESIQYALRRVVGPYRAERLLVSGTLVDALEAERIGLVDELADVDHVTAHAIAWLEELLKLPPNAMHSTRAIARADLIDVIADPRRLDLSRFLDEWYGEETQATLGAMVARMGSGKR